MNWRKFFSIVFSFIFILFATSLLVIYWFFPFRAAEFNIQPQNSNFSLNVSTDMQFYKNLRYKDKRISYKIDSCTLQKQNDMERAFEILENISVLEFYPVILNEEISISCESKIKHGDENNFFIAGEGGPVNITRTENFNVILNGMVLLLRGSKCPEPNVGLHELLHALGFDHSENSNNIMYSLSKCQQTIGEDIPQLINELYSYSSYADLTFENTSATMHNRYLNLNMTIRNNGLENSGKAKIEIYTDDKLLREVDLEEIDIGSGRLIVLTNVLVSKLSFNKLNIFINSSFEELDKKNNKIVLEIKK